MFDLFVDTQLMDKLFVIMKRELLDFMLDGLVRVPTLLFLKIQAGIMIRTPILEMVNISSLIPLMLYLQL